MKLVKFHISDVLGITSFEADVKGNIIEISGDNDTFKTSIMTAIMKAIQPGNPVQIIRQGQDQAEIVLEFDTGHVLTTTIHREKAPRRTIKKDKMKVERTKEWLEERINAMSFNPVTFVNASGAERLQMLLSVVPLSVDYNDLKQACGDWMPADITGNDSFLLYDPLETVDKIYNDIFHHRTGLNASIKMLDGHIASLQATLPAIDENPDPEGIETKLKDAKAKLEVRKAEVEENELTFKLKIDAEKKAAEMAEQKRHEDELARIHRTYVEAVHSLNKSTNTVIDGINSQYNADTAELREKLGDVKAKKQQLQQAVGTRIAMNKSIATREQQQKEAEGNTDAITALKAVRKRMFEKLPVPGLTIVDGQLMLDKGKGPLPYDTENEATRVDIAMKLAAAGAGELKMIFMDGFEALSKKSRKLFRAWASKCDAQFFYCLVKDDAPLEVNSEPDTVGPEEPTFGDALMECPPVVPKPIPPEDDW
jgi:hypothetical protein